MDLSTEAPPGGLFYLGLPVVRCDLVKLLVQLELYFHSFERGHGLHGVDPLIVHAEQKAGLGHVSDLPGGKADTCEITSGH